MIRRSVFNINYSTQNKLEQLNVLIEEYKKCVNYFIDQNWKNEKLLVFKTGLELVPNSWLSKRLTQECYKKAIECIKAVRKKDRNKRFNTYKKLYYNCKKKNIHSQFTEKRFNELKLNWKIKPIFNSDSIQLNQRFIDVSFDRNSFDCWIKLSSLGNKINIKLPSKKHTHFNNLIKNNYEVKQSGCLRKLNNKFYFDLYLEKETPKIKQEGNKLGIDLGINKLISTSDNQTYGKEIKSLLNQLDNKVYASNSYKRKVNQIKNYIKENINKLDFKSLNLIVIEDLKNISKNTKKEKRTNKKVRKYLSRWNFRLFQESLRQKCEENGVYLASVSPAYTSQTCSHCGNVDKANRVGEKYSCQCGYSADADINGAKNILLFYLVGNLPLPT